MMEAIAVQPYVIIERVVENQEQITKFHDHELCLFETKITSPHREFPIHQVYDMSFRIIGGEERFLYFHTHQGVQTFVVRTDPSPFIQAYRDLKTD